MASPLALVVGKFEMEHRSGAEVIFANQGAHQCPAGRASQTYKLPVSGSPHTTLAILCCVGKSRRSSADLHDKACHPSDCCTEPLMFSECIYQQIMSATHRGTCPAVAP